MRDPFPLVCQLGDELERRRDGWQKAKALVLLVALSGDWNLGACQLADALGIPPHLQEEIRLEALRHLAEGKIVYPQAA